MGNAQNVKGKKLLVMENFLANFAIYLLGNYLIKLMESVILAKMVATQMLIRWIASKLIVHQM